MPIPASATNSTAVDEIAAKSMAQAPALEAFNKIYDLVIYDTTGTPEYHDYYSGSYINDDNVLVICVKNGGTELVNTLNTVLGDEYDVEYDFCDWSKNEVLAFAQSEISTFSTKESVTVSGGYYRARDNAYILEVINTSEMQTFSASTTGTRNIPVIIRDIEASPTIVSDAPILASPQNTIAATSNTPIYGGTGMHLTVTYNNQTDEYQNGATLALCGYFNGIPCILTAAHCCMDTQDSLGNPVTKRLYMDTNFTIELQETSLQVHGIGDYAALTIPSGYVATNYIITTSTGGISPISDYFMYSEIPENTIIYKSGVSTEVTSSQVDGNNAINNANGGVSSLIVSVPLGSEAGENNANNKIEIVDDGDSGGPVWTFNSNGNVVLVGLVQGMSIPNDDITQPNQMYVTPIRFPINSGFIPYGMMNP